MKIYRQELVTCHAPGFSVALDQGDKLVDPHSPMGLVIIERAATYHRTVKGAIDALMVRATTLGVAEIVRPHLGELVEGAVDDLAAHGVLPEGATAPQGIRSVSLTVRPIEVVA